MKRNICFILCTLHLIALAISTYIASIDIETIMVSGVVCSITGIAAAIAAIRCKRLELVMAGFSTSILAVTLVLLEAFVFQLGPQRAAFPFCVIFIINQIITAVMILIG